MIQDIAPAKLYNQYDPNRQPKEQDVVIIYDDQRILVSADEAEKTLTFPIIKEMKKLNLINNNLFTYLFSVDDVGFFLARTDVAAQEEIWNQNGFSFVNMRKLREVPLLPKAYVFAAFTAMHLAEWYQHTKYCGICGQKLKHDDKERAMRCPHCNEIFYPRINPAVIVGVINGDRLLLTKYKTGFAHNALIAGFVEIGETLEETVMREVYEEAGIHVKNIRYYKSQPWGIASDLLAGFFCELDGDDSITMDHTELKYAQWVPREEIELQPRDYSLTNEMMKLFRSGKE